MGCSRRYSTPDFLGLDFLNLDFYTENPPYESTNEVIFREYLFDKLPYYFLNQDTYKDSEGRGLLQRYLTLFGDYLDEYVIGEIECYLNIIDSSLTSSKYLTDLSATLGNPPDIFKDENKYRNLLHYISSVYKIKGTLESYKLFFSILGYDIILTEIPIPNILDSEKVYDATGQYDNGNIYDADKCQPCSEYDITFIPVNGQVTGVSEDTLSKINQSIQFNEPINAKLRYLTMGIQLTDNFGISITDSSTEDIT